MIQQAVEEEVTELPCRMKSERRAAVGRASGLPERARQAASFGDDRLFTGLNGVLSGVCDVARSGVYRVRHNQVHPAPCACCRCPSHLWIRRTERG